MTQVASKKNVAFGKRLKEARLKKGITQTDLAIKCGFSSSAPISKYERGNSYPNDRILSIISKELDVSTSWIAEGVKALPVAKPEVKESHKDPTASTAMNSVWKSLTPADVGDIADDNIGQLYLVLQKFEGDYAIVLHISMNPVDSRYGCSVKYGEKLYHVELNNFKTTDQLSKKYRKRFKISDTSYSVVLNKFRKLLGIDAATVVIQKEASNDIPKEPDEASSMFAESVKFYNERNHTSAPCPDGVLSLQQAVDISHVMGVKLDDLCRDREKDKAEEQILLWMEEQEKLNEKIEALKQKFDIA